MYIDSKDIGLGVVIKNFQNHKNQQLTPTVPYIPLGDHRPQSDTNRYGLPGYIQARYKQPRAPG